MIHKYYTKKKSDPKTNPCGTPFAYRQKRTLCFEFKN